jgi:hypothetical protein
MHADTYFARGKTHLVCQDYARHGDEDHPVTLVADGCSSSPDSDFGSRFITLAAQERYLDIGMVDFHWVIRRALDTKPSVLDILCLDATLLALYPMGSHVQVLVSGDGVVTARRRDGVIETWYIRFKPNQNRVAPAYLSYTLDPARLRHYLDLGYGCREVYHYIGGELQGDPEELQVTTDPETFIHGFLLDPLMYDFIAIASDGAESFQYKGPRGKGQDVDPEEVMQHLTAIKSSKARFVARRVSAFLTRHCIAQGWWHNDDLAVGALWTGDVVAPEDLEEEVEEGS